MLVLALALALAVEDWLCERGMIREEMRSRGRCGGRVVERGPSVAVAIGTVKRAKILLSAYGATGIWAVRGGVAQV